MSDCLPFVSHSLSLMILYLFSVPPLVLSLSSLSKSLHSCLIHENRVVLFLIQKADLTKNKAHLVV